MNCPNCGIENPEEANFCRGCGLSLKKKFVFDNITFKHTFKKVHPTIRITLWMLLCSVVIVLPTLLFSYFGDLKVKALLDNDVLNKVFLDEEKNLNIFFQVIDIRSIFEDLLVLTCSILSINAIFLAFSFCFFIQNNLRWRSFELGKSFDEIKMFLLTLNKTKNAINITVTKNGELILKDNTIRSSSLFYLIRNNKDEALIIGDKDETQSFIRSAFGANIDFIRYKNS